MECEFAFLVTARIEARADGWPVSELAERVELHAVVEIIGNRYPTGSNASKPSTNDEIADNGAGIGFVFGDPIAGWRTLDLSNLVIDIKVDERPLAENFLVEGRCPPLQSLQQAAKSLGERGIAVEAGQYVSTGAATDPQPVVAGSVVRADFGGLAVININFSHD